MENRLNDETQKARENQSRAEQLVAQLELTNQKVDRLNLDSSAKKSNVEMRLKGQIGELESQLEESSRQNYANKQQAEQMESEVHEVQQDLSASRIDLDRAHLQAKDSEALIDQL